MTSLKSTLFIILLATPLVQAQEYLWPLKTNPGLAASFCEFRPRHFHGGVDMKTWGVRSLPCLAIADGVVSRIKVQAAGYGKALYLTLPSGETAVYAHLDHFVSPVAEKVRAIQEATGNFEVDLFWEGDSAIPYKRGDIVAYSGVTGTVHPHLHFEIRDASQGPMNPLTHGIYAADHIAPIPVALAIQPLDGASTVENDFQPRLYTRLLKNPKGVYELGDPVGASGRIGISVDAYDQADNALNEMAVYEIQLDVGGETYWTTKYEGFDFTETRCIEIERDYRIMRRGKGSYHRLYRAPGNRLRMLSGDGVIDAGLADAYPIPIMITLADACGNFTKISLTIVSDAVEDTSRGISGTPMITGNGWSNRSRGEVGIDWFDNYLRFAGQPGVKSFKVSGAIEQALPAISVAGGAAAVLPLPRDLHGILQIEALSSAGRRVEDRTLRLDYAGRELPSMIASDDSLLLIEIPSESLYDDVWLTVEKEEGYEIPGQIESVYRVDPRDQPISRPVKVKIKRAAGSPKEKGWGVFYLYPGRGWTFLGAAESNGYIVGEANTWDRFGLLRDDDSPKVSLSLPKGTVTSDHSPEFAAVVKDSLSGITSSGIVLKLDGRRVPVEYDQPRARAYYRPLKPLQSGSHTYEFVVTDRIGNTTRREVKFTIN